MAKEFLIGVLSAVILGAAFYISFSNSDAVIEIEQCHITEAGAGHCYINGQSYDVHVDYSRRAIGELAHARCTNTKSWGWSN